MNKWLKLAVVAFTGLLVASFALGLTNSAGGAAHETAGVTGAAGDGSAAAAQGQHAGHSQGGQSNGTDQINAVQAGYNQGYGAAGNAGMSNVDVQMQMMQNRIMQLQLQLEHMTQMYYQQTSMPGGMNGGAGMNNTNMGGSAPANNQMNGQSNSGGGGMGMM